MIAPSRVGAESPTRVLAEFAAGLALDEVPTDVRDRVKRILLDSLACALAADSSEETGIVTRASKALGTDGGSTVIGLVAGRPIAAATMLNGFRITAMTACDVYRPAHCHMTPEVIPPALGIAEESDASGSELLTALVVGLETAVRVARGMATDEFRARRWHAPGVVGPFGGAAAAGRLLGLDPGTMRNALAIAGSQAAGTYVAHGTPTVKFHQAHGAVSGLLGALLANEGLRGAAEVLAGTDGGLLQTYSGGGDANAITEGIGDHWESSEISLRLWAGGTHVQPPMTAAHRLVTSDPVDWARISRVAVRVAPSVVASQSKYSRPRGTFECLASVEYTVAVMLRWHQVSLEYFMPPTYDDQALRSFIEDRVEMTADDGLTPSASAIDVVLDDGSRRSAKIDIPKGHPDDWLSWDELALKTHDFGDSIIGPSRVDELIRIVSNLEEQSSVRHLLTLTRGQ